MRGFLAVLVVMSLPICAMAEEQWVEVGADTEAKYYVDTGSIEVEGETIRFRKRGVYTNPLTDNFSGRPVLFKESVGTVEVDCGRHINRVIAIDMLGPEGEVVWSSGKMSKRMWEEVRENTHGGSTFDYICRSLGKS
jgi:hypothetical protein